MATFAFIDPTVWIAGHDMTGDLNSAAVNFTTDELDATPFGNGGYRKRIAGFKSVSAEFGGFWQAGSGQVDPAIFPDLGVADRVVTVAPDAAEETVAYLWQGGAFRYPMFGAAGEVTPFSLTHMGTNGVGGVRGQIAKANGDVSATGALGSVVNLGTVGAEQFLYASFHVFAAATTITIDVESDDNAGMTTPTSRITIGPLTATGGTWATRLAGPLTDDHFRFNVTAITGTFTVAGAIAIG